MDSLEKTKNDKSIIPESFQKKSIDIKQFDIKDFQQDP